MAPPPAAGASSEQRERLAAYTTPGGFASPRRHGADGNCADDDCVKCIAAPPPPDGGWPGPRLPPRPPSAARGARGASCCAAFAVRPYVELVAADAEARRVALFLSCHLAVLGAELLLPALWQLDAALLAAGLRGLLRSVALGLVLHAMVAAKAAPTADFSYG